MKTAHKQLKELFAERSPSDVAIEINGFTGWRTTLLEELTDHEAETLLKIHLPREKDLEDECNALLEEMKRKEWKSAILALAERTGIKDPGDFQKFNNWMFTKSKFKKHLNAHSLEELKALHAQLRAAHANNVRSAQKVMTKAWCHKAEKNKTWN